MDKNYKPVPVEAAKEIADKYVKSVVIIFAHDPIYGYMHTTTYGRNSEEKAWAAQGGEIVTKQLGYFMAAAVDFEDYRLMQAKKLLDELKRVEKFAVVTSVTREVIEEAEKFLGVT